MESTPRTLDAAPAVYDALSTTLRGTVIRPGDADYDAARRLWNGMIDRRPALIVRCRDTADVVDAVVAARAHGLPIAVRGGGHNAAGLALCDDGLVIDLSPMRAVHVDPDARTARAEGGATWADVDAATQAHGLATTGGAISSTGVGGLTLGGGLGWLMRLHGLACDNLIEAEVVTADGRRLTASETEHADLFWGLRGGGGNFGVVTSLTYRLHPVGPVTAGMLVHPLTSAAKILRAYREYVRKAPDALTVFAVLLTPPDSPPALALVPCYIGPHEEAERVLHELRELGPPVADQVGPMPYVALQQMMDAALPSGLHVYWRSEFLATLDDDVIETLVDRYAAATSPLSLLLIEQLGGAMGRVDRDATAFPHRAAPFNLAMVARWTDPAERDTHVRWARETHDAIRPFAQGGVYVNYLGAEEGADRVRDAYGADHHARLVAVKDAYDPTNVFRYNQNVAPTQPA